MLLFYYKKNKK